MQRVEDIEFFLERVREIDALTCLCASRVEEIEMMMRDCE